MTICRVLVAHTFVCLLACLLVCWCVLRHSSIKMCVHFARTSPSTSIQQDVCSPCRNSLPTATQTNFVLQDRSQQLDPDLGSPRLHSKNSFIPKLNIILECSSVPHPWAIIPAMCRHGTQQGAWGWGHACDNCSQLFSEQKQA